MCLLVGRVSGLERGFFLVWSSLDCRESGGLVIYFFRWLASELFRVSVNMLNSFFRRLEFFRDCRLVFTLLEFRFAGIERICEGFVRLVLYILSSG